MTIQVTGVLPNPIGVGVANATIRIVALEVKSTLPFTEASIITGSSGEYDFNLLEGKYSLEILQTDTYHKVAYIEVTSGTITPVSLEVLIEDYAFCSVEAPTCAD